MTSFAYQELLPLGADETPYRLLTGDFVSTFEAGGRRFVQVDPKALTLLTKTAMFEISHLLRSGHLAQLRAILDASRERLHSEAETTRGRIREILTPEQRARFDRMRPPPPPPGPFPGPPPGAPPPGS